MNGFKEKYLMNEKCTKTVYSFIGLPASGKGTQAAILSQKMKVDVIGVGDLIRATIDESDSDPFVSAIEKRYDKGVPQPDEVVIDLVKSYLSHEKHNVIFDNFPFSTTQADFLTHFAEQDDWNLVLLYIKISDETAVKRVVLRKICAECGEIADGNDGMICDKCGGALVVRSDDNEETVKKRIAFYDPRIKEVLQYYNDRNITVFEIDGEKAVADVTAQISQII